MSASPFIQLAPMEGVVDVVVRHLLSEKGGVDRLVTEFVRVTERLLPNHVFYKYCPELLTNKGYSVHNIPVYVQLLGGQPSVLSENAHKVVELGAPGIDLNFGCPAKTVNRHDGGATLLKNPERLFQIITAVKAAVRGKVPVTAKVRLGFSDKSLVKDIAQAVDSAGAASLTVHARTKLEGYAPPAHWEFIRSMKDEVRLPVIANGDIWSVKDYLRCVEISGCENVALGRGLMSRPTLAREIKAHLAGVEITDTDWGKILQEFLPKFIKLTLQYRGESYTIPRTKQLLKFLSREYPEAKKLFERVKLCQNLSELEGVLNDHSPNRTLLSQAAGQDVHMDLLPFLPKSQGPVGSQTCKI